MKLECKECGSEVKATLRTSGKKTDYKCLNKECGCRKVPVIVEEEEEENRVLVIPDLHFPFVIDGYLEFVKSIYDKYDCNQVVQGGDILDMHYSSFHDSDPDGLSENEEFNRSVEYIKELAETFPNMKVCGGNHDAIPNRKAFSAGLSSRWVKSIKDVMLEMGAKVEGWDFSHYHIIDSIKYTHGTGRKAKQRMLQDGVSIVQFHYHAESYVWFHANSVCKNFAMQLGALVDDKAYAFAYGKEFAKSHKNCGVVINGVPTIEYMDLGSKLK